MEPIALAFLHDHAADTAAIFYHAGWPGGGDPFYLHASGDCNARIADYSIVRIPYMKLGGVIEPNFLYTYSRIQAGYDARKAVPTSVTLEAQGSYAPSSGDLHLELTALTDAPLPAGDYRIYASLTESAIPYAAPNGITEHDHTHRRFIPGPEGSPVTFEGVPPASASVSLDVQVDPLYVTKNCRVVYFLQDAASYEVHQAGSVSLSDLPEPTAVGRTSLSAVKSLY